MDMESCLPLLYPLRYHIDHLAHRSPLTAHRSSQHEADKLAELKIRCEREADIANSLLCELSGAGQSLNFAINQI